MQGCGIILVCTLGDLKVQETATKNEAPELQGVQSELITGSVVVAAIVIFIWTGGSAMTAVVRYLTGVGPNVEQVLLTTLLLNIALILFGWRRYRDLQVEVRLRRDAEERAKSLAETDPLTGFLNRRSLSEKGEALFEEAKRTDQSVAMLLLDLDNFKQVNDAHGHAAGDLVLTTVASRIRMVMPKGALTARLGGDEFACVLLCEPDAQEILDRFAGELVLATAHPIPYDNFQLKVSLSIGIAKSELETENIDTLARSADVAMYRAKKKGRNCYAWFDGSIRHELAKRNQIEAEIREGIPKGEFTPYYEPRVSLADNRLTGFEMLARWQHPTDGLLTPEDFISVAEKADQIGELSLAIMQRAFLDAREWDNALKLSVNVSPRQLKDPWFSQKLQKLFIETGLQPSRLELEVSEASLFEDLSLAQTIIGSLKDQGVHIALNDFGTGYGALSHLRSLPFDRIKISRKYVSSVNRNTESASIVSTIIHFGESLGLPVTAVGVEDAAIQQTLKEFGCDEGQGWIFGRPMPVEDVRHILAEQNLLLSPHMEQAATDRLALAKLLPLTSGRRAS